MRDVSLTAGVVGIRSWGLALRKAALRCALADHGQPRLLLPGAARPHDLVAMAGWGHRPTADSARQAAIRWNVPYLALEDGFLRSYDLGVHRGRLLSLVVDPVGIYYDASHPSALEQIIQNWQTLAPAELKAAAELMAVMRQHGLGKYNSAADLTDADPLGRERALVLVVDQTYGDASIAAGQVDARTFERMLQAARDENPDAEIRVRVHPDVIAGKRRGYLAGVAARLGVPLEARAVSWASLVRRARRVYTATSQAGLEALIQGVPVSCFGLPFYAGWGLTDDRMTCPRRTARPRLEALVAAAYLRYCRYINPLTGARSDAFTVAKHLALCRERDAANAGHTEVLGIRPWKRWQMDRFLGSGHGTLHYAPSASAALENQRRRGGRIVVWAAREPADLAQAAAQQGAPLVRMEDGFLRSVGLGSNHVAGASLVVDARGIYFDPRRPSALEHLLESGQFTHEVLLRAAHLRRILVDSGLTKYNYGGAQPITIGAASGQRRILVPGQVEDDASVRLGSPQIRGNLELLRQVREAAPQAWIVYKPHPDTEVGNRDGHLSAETALGHADQIVSGVSITALFPQVDEVHTMTSLAGFEALLRGLAVVTYGAPFYAGWGLTRDRLAFPRRRRRVSLDELVAGALILYPRYVDPATGLPCAVEHVADQLAQRREKGVPFRPTRLRRALLFCSGLIRSWTSALGVR